MFSNPLQITFFYAIISTIVISIGYFFIIYFKERKAKIRYSLSNYINDTSTCLSVSRDDYYKNQENCPIEWADDQLYKKSFIKYNRN